MTHSNKQAGFTIIELLMVIIILSVVGVAGAKMLTQALQSFLTLQNTSNATWQGQVAVERMTRELRYVRSAVDVLTQTSAQFQFVDIYGNTIAYTLSGSNLVRNSQTLASGVNSLTFTYMDQNGNTITGSTNLHYVGISMNVTQNNSNYTLTTSIFLDDLSA